MIARIAARQHGVVTAAQLLAADLTREMIKVRVARGRLHRVHRGVYRVGHEAPSVEVTYLAAVLACGHRAALSHLAAAHLQRLIKGPPPPPEVSAVLARRCRGVITHRVRTVEGIDCNGIPTTPVGRTLADLAPLLGIDDLARACHEADVRHRLDPDAVLKRAHAGAWKLRAILQGDHPTVLSKLESLFLAALRGRGLPLPQTNRRDGAHYVDCRWPGLTIELDSYRFHRTRHAWEEDHDRRRAARRRGDEFRRFTWRDVTEEPEPMLDEVEELLVPPTSSTGHYPFTATAR